MWQVFFRYSYLLALFSLFTMLVSATFPTSSQNSTAMKTRIAIRISSTSFTSSSTLNLFLNNKNDKQKECKFHIGEHVDDNEIEVCFSKVWDWMVKGPFMNSHLYIGMGPKTVACWFSLRFFMHRGEPGKIVNWGIKARQRRLSNWFLKVGNSVFRTKRENLYSTTTSFWNGFTPVYNNLTNCRSPVIMLLCGLLMIAWSWCLFFLSALFD